MLSSKAESKLIANSGQTPPPLSPGSAVARILLPTPTAGWVGEGVFPTARIVSGSRVLFQGGVKFVPRGAWPRNLTDRSQPTPCAGIPRPTSVSAVHLQSERCSRSAEYAAASESPSNSHSGYGTRLFSFAPTGSNTRLDRGPQEMYAECRASLVGVIGWGRNGRSRPQQETA